MMPMVSPLAICRSISVSASFSAVAAYLKSTWSKSTEPSATSVRAPSGLDSVLSVSSTSVIRFMDSSDIVTMTKINETIIRLKRICVP